jgi:hypothetical protein
VHGNDLAALVAKKGGSFHDERRGNATLAALDARRPAGRVESATIEELKRKVDDLDKDLKSVAKGIAAAALRVDENFNKIHAQLAELKSMLEKIEK